jgi:hypothetical protein
LLDLSEDFKKNFPQSTERILCMKENLTPLKEAAFENTSGATPEQIGKALEPGEGPAIIPSPIYEAGDGSYKEGTGTLKIGEQTFKDYEAGKEGAGEILDRVVEHELVHYFLDQNKMRGSGEPGYTYERIVYGDVKIR